MSVTVEWDDAQQTIVRMICEGRWTLDEFRNANAQTVLMVRSMRHPVYIITDLKASDHIPAGILWRLREMIGLRPPNWGGGIVISDSGLAVGILDMFTQVYMPDEQRLFIVRTNAEAYAAIEKLKKQKQVG